MDLDGDGAFDLEERFNYGENDRLESVESVILEGEERVVLTTTFEYTCD